MNAQAADILDQLLEDGVSSEVQEPPAVPPPRQAIKKTNYSHAGMVDLIIAHPGMSQNEVAARVGYSAAWVSTIMATDAFQSLLASRSDEIIDPILRATVKEQLEGVLRRSMEILREKLSKPSDAIPDNLVLRSAELASRALGYGAKTEATVIQVNVENHLEELGGRLTGLLQRRKAEVISVDVGEEG